MSVNLSTEYIKFVMRLKYDLKYLSCFDTFYWYKLAIKLHISNKKNSYTVTIKTEKVLIL